MAEKLGEAVLELSTDPTKLDKGLGSAQSKLKNFGANLTKTGRSLTTKLTLPLVAAGTASVKMAADFEKSMSQIVGLVGVSSDQVAQWSDQILALGPQLGKSPKELADAMFFITSAGLRGEEAMEALTAAAKASTAGLGDMTAVADALTSAVNAYGSDTLSASKATDVLVATVREGKLSADELAGSIGRVIPLAAQMGVDFEEVGAAMATLTRIGFNTAEAGTSLTAIMTGLLKPSQEANEMFAKLGTSAAELRQRVDDEGLLNVLMSLEQQVDGDAAAMAAMFPNVRALRGILGALGANADSTAQIMENMGDVTGSTDTAFEEATGTLAFQFNQALGNFKAALIEVGEVVGPIVLPILNRLADGVRRVASWFRNLSPETQKFVVAAAAIAAALGPVLLVLGQLIPAIGALVGVVTSAAAPWVLLAGAAIAAAVLIIKNWDEVKAFFVRFAGAVKNIFQGIDAFIAGAVAGSIDQVRLWFVDKLGDIADWVKLRMGEIANRFTELRNKVREWRGKEPLELIDLDVLKANLDAADDAQEKARAEALQKMQNTFARGEQLIAAGAGEIRDMGVELGTNLWEGAKGAWEKVSGIFKELFKKEIVEPAADASGEAEKDAEKIVEDAEGAAAAVAGQAAMTTEEIAAMISEEMAAMELQRQNSMKASLDQLELEKQIAEERRQLIMDHLNLVAEQFSQIQAITSQYFKNQEISLDNDYGKRKAAIEANISDETAREEALAALDEEFDKKRRDMRIKQAKAEKAQALVSAIINTARAVVRALPNIPLSIIVGALGAAQIALIAAQPIPQFQRGADFIVPPGFEDDSFPMLASSGERVQVTPEDAVGRGGMGQPIHIVVNLDGEVLADFVTQATRDRRIIVDTESVR